LGNQIGYLKLVLLMMKNHRRQSGFVTGVRRVYQPARVVFVDCCCVSTSFCPLGHDALWDAEQGSSKREVGDIGTEEIALTCLSDSVLTDEVTTGDEKW